MLNKYASTLTRKQLLSLPDHRIPPGALNCEYMMEFSAVIVLPDFNPAALLVKPNDESYDTVTVIGLRGGKPIGILIRHCNILNLECLTQPQMMVDVFSRSGAIRYWNRANKLRVVPGQSGSTTHICIAETPQDMV